MTDIDPIVSLLIDVNNKLDDLWSDELEGNALVLYRTAREAAEDALIRAQEFQTYLNTDWEAVYEDRYWDQKIDEAKGK